LPNCVYRSKCGSLHHPKVTCNSSAERTGSYLRLYTYSCQGVLCVLCAWLIGSRFYCPSCVNAPSVSPCYRQKSIQLSLQSLPFLKQDLLFSFLLQISTSAFARHEHRAGKRMLERIKSRRVDRGSPEGWALRG
jgi:hypothetical protein